ncbi:hypothetical protein ACSBR2_011230 [Camellia fascicularis]
MNWLDAQVFKSVIYVSFGSITMVTKDQLMEFWHGLINSGKRSANDLFALLYNSRFVEEVWKFGLDMKDSCDRVIIEKMVKDLMDVRSDEFVELMDEISKLITNVISEGGLL